MIEGIFNICAWIVKIIFIFFLEISKVLFQNAYEAGLIHFLGGFVLLLLILFIGLCFAVEG